MGKTERFDPRSHIGEVHGVYEIVDMLDEKDKYGHWIYKGVCQECGYVKYSHYGDFSGEKSRVNVCKHVGINGQYIDPTKWSNKRIAHIFAGMKGRCYTETNKDFPNYGAKGIKICQEWLDDPKLFEEWSLKHGYDDNLTIDRIDGSKDYCPGNCRWITLEENAKNKPTTNFLTVDGESHTGREWSKILGFNNSRINQYVNQHGKENVEEFIKRYKKMPGIKPKNKQSYYDLYMNDLKNLDF